MCLGLIAPIGGDLASRLPPILPLAGRQLIEWVASCPLILHLVAACHPRQSDESLCVGIAGNAMSRDTPDCSADEYLPHLPAGFLLGSGYGPVAVKAYTMIVSATRHDRSKCSRG